jgi:hypothetical protein
MALFNLWEQDKIKRNNKDNLFNTETMLPISEIKNDTLILKDSWIRAILKVDGVNLDLKNFDEQEILLEQYKRFLNWLSFPIQIVVRNNYLDLSKYLNYISANLTKITNPTLKSTWDSYFKFLQNIDSKQWLIYEKTFYIIVPFYDDDQNEKDIKKPWFSKLLNVLNTKDDVESIVARYRQFNKGKNMLDMRCNLVVEWLNAIGITTERMNTGEIISLLFNYYNPLLHNAQSNLNS